MTTTPETLSTRLRAAADDITFIGRMDPHRDAATLREAAERIESLEFDATAHERRLAEVREQAAIAVDPKRILAEIESLKASVEGYRKHMQEIGQYLITAHAPGVVDEAAVAILDGYHVGATPVAGGGAGEPGEHTLGAALRILKLGMSRGAYAPGKHIHTPAGPMLELAAEAGVVGGEEGLDITVLAEHLTTTFAKLEDWIRSDGPLDDGEPHLIAMTEAIGDLDQLAGELRVLAEDARIAAGRLVTALEYPQDHQITVMEEAAVKLDSIAAAIEPGHAAEVGDWNARAAGAMEGTAEFPIGTGDPAQDQRELEFLQASKTPSAAS